MELLCFNHLCLWWFHSEHNVLHAWVTTIWHVTGKSEWNYDCLWWVSRVSVYNEGTTNRLILSTKIGSERCSFVTALPAMLRLPLPYSWGIIQENVTRQRTVALTYKFSSCELCDRSNFFPRLITYWPLVASYCNDIKQLAIFLGN